MKNIKFPCELNGFSAKTSNASENGYNSSSEGTQVEKVNDQSIPFSFKSASYNISSLVSAQNLNLSEKIGFEN
jgi:hypothetical protein